MLGLYGLNISRRCKPAPLFVQCGQIPFALVLEINSNGTRGKRTFPRQMFHPQIDVVDPSQHALDAMQPFGELDRIRPEHRPKELGKITRFAESDPQSVQFPR